MTQRNYDASMLTFLMRDRANANFYKRQAYLTNTSANPAINYPLGNPQSGNFDASLIGNVAAGSYTTYTKAALLSVPSVPCSCEVLGLPPVPVDPPVDLSMLSAFAAPVIDPLVPVDVSVLYAFEAFLTYAATQNYPPTVMSRLLYLWFASVVGAWNWVQDSPQLSGTVDSWTWTTQSSLSYDDSTTWLILAINHIMPYFVPSGYDSTYLLNRTQTCHGWTNAELAAAIQRIQDAGTWSTWTTTWSTWYTNRGGDGSTTWKVGVTPPTPVVAFVNGATYLNVNDTVDPATYADPSGWTPLWIQAVNVGGTWTGGIKQKYATYNWSAVTSTCLSANDETDLSGLAAPFFPGAAERQSELADLVNITATLTDSEKLTAEWWAGGPYTLTPPGILMWFWKHYMATYGSGEGGDRAFLLSGLQIAVGLFETSRVVWAQKLAYKQARPIQEIRRLYRGQVLTGYNGQGVSGEAWRPYQEANFVTPPFPDFVSGHSAFSATFAAVMAQWFGDTIRTDKTVALTDLGLVTPMLAGSGQTQTFGTVVIPAGSSLVQPGVVPASPVTLGWTTWSDLATSAGVSRQYGGIHAQSAHLGSLALVNGSTGLYQKIRTYWNFY